MSDNFIFCKLLKKIFFVNFYWIFYIENKFRYNEKKNYNLFDKNINGYFIN